MTYFLRPFQADDYKNLLTLIRHTGIDYPFWYRDGMKPEQAAAEHIAMATAAQEGTTQDLIYAIMERNSGHEGNSDRLIGGVSPEGFENRTAEIGYFLATAYQGIGLGKWAAHDLVSRAVREHGLREVYTTVHPKKINSIHILEKTLGLSREGYIEKSKYCEPDGTPAPRIKYRGRLADIQAALARWDEQPLRPLHCSSAKFLVGLSQK